MFSFHLSPRLQAVLFLRMLPSHQATCFQGPSFKLASMRTLLLHSATCFYKVTFIPGTSSLRSLDSMSPPGYREPLDSSIPPSMSKWRQTQQSVVSCCPHLPLPQWHLHFLLNCSGTFSPRFTFTIEHAFHLSCAVQYFSLEDAHLRLHCSPKLFCCFLYQQLKCPLISQHCFLCPKHKWLKNVTSGPKSSLILGCKGILINILIVPMQAAQNPPLATLQQLLFFLISHPGLAFQPLPPGSPHILQSYSITLTSWLPCPTS